VTQDEVGPEAGGEAAPGPPNEPEPTLQEEFAELRPELGQSMLGKPAQLVTGLLIGAVLLVGLLIGLTTLAKDGAVPLISPAPVPTASAVP
jgi:hypothetical protein